MLDDVANQEHEDMRERLARIEANQTHIGKQLDRVVMLLDRLVRVEEHVEEHKRTLSILFTRLEKAESELETWRLARKVMIWFGGIGTALAATLVALASKPSG